MNMIVIEIFFIIITLIFEHFCGQIKFLFFNIRFTIDSKF